MGTDIRPEISKKKIFYIERHRYYELKHFCLQYPIWKKAKEALDSRSRTSLEAIRSSDIPDPVQRCVEAREHYSKLMDMVETAAKKTDEYLGKYIFYAVTQDLSYETLRANHNIPCGKDNYYILYRKFFWTLSKLRDK